MAWECEEEKAPSPYIKSVFCKVKIVVLTLNSYSKHSLNGKSPEKRIGEDYSNKSAINPDIPTLCVKL